MTPERDAQRAPLPQPLARPPHLEKARQAAGPDDPASLALSDEDLRFLARIVHESSGIVIRDNKSAMTRGRLMRRVKALGLASIAEYIALLRSPRRDGELRELLNAVTTNHTSFFRERHHFDQLANEVLPAILARRPARLRLWSAACSSGEEAYSMAAVLHQALKGRPSCDARILATDLDTEMVEKARAGEYADDVIDRAPSDLTPLLGASQSRPGHRVIHPALRALVTVRELNLLEDWPFSGPFDVIFCRNVMIYFDQPTKLKLVDRFADYLDPQGTLFIGHSESLGPAHARLRLTGRTAYARIGTQNG
jgi:chemotaxis protein methyltransferase CheR